VSIPAPSNIAPQTVIVAQKAWEVIGRTALAAGRAETGGLLVGRRVYAGEKSLLVVVEASGPGEKADRQLFTYAPEVDALQHALNEACQRYYARGLKVDYIGEWHKHPARMNYLSGGDVKEGCSILDDPGYNLEYGEILLPIVTVGGRKTKNPEVLLNIYYLSRTCRQPQPIEWVVWEDSLSDRLLEQGKQICT